MKIKLGTFLTTLLFSLTAFSQSDINKVSISADSCKIYLPCDISRQVVVDLLEGDLAKRELELTQEKLYNIQQVVLSQDEIITSYRTKIQLFGDQVKMQSQKEDLYKDIVLGLEKDKRIQKTRIKILGISIGAASITTIVGFLLR